MTNFRALNTLTIYSNILKIMVLIQITLCRNARIQMNLSKNNHFSAEEPINDIPHTEKRKKVPVCEMFESSWSLSSHILPILPWKLKIMAYTGSIKIPPSSKLELLCQYEMTFIVPKSSIIDAWGSEILIWFVCFLCKTLLKRIKLNEVYLHVQSQQEGQ